VKKVDFFYNQESLTTVEWILRSIISFIFLLFAAKLMGQSSISQLRFLDFIIALTLGNILAHPLSDEKLGLTGPMITTFALILLYIATTWLGLKWPLFRRFLDPQPIKLIENGQIQFHNLAIARISVEYLFSELRKEKVEDIQKVSLALWEPGGNISVFINPLYQPLTPFDMKLEPQPFNLTRPIIVEGKIDFSILNEIGKDVIWLKKIIATSPNKELRDVKLATIDKNQNVRFHSTTESEHNVFHD
jgi:uncharacterized membrane protein YcaP (DUF421 family)